MVYHPPLDALAQFRPVSSHAPELPTVEASLRQHEPEDKASLRPVCEVLVVSAAGILSFAPSFDVHLLVILGVLLLAASHFFRHISVRAPLVPAGWYPLAYVLLLGAVLPYTRLYGPPPWFESSSTLQHASGDYVRLILSGYIGLRVGFVITRARTLTLPSLRVQSRSVLAFVALALCLCGASLLLLWATRTLPDVGAYGEGQFVYGGLYYVRQAAQAVFFPSLAVFSATASRQGLGRYWHPTLAAALLVALAFLVPTVVWGDRSGLLYALVLVATPAALRARHPSPRRVLLFGAAAGVLASTMAVWGYLRVFRSLADADLLALVNPVRFVLAQGAATGGVVAATMDLVPATSPFLIGRSFGASVLSLFPGFLFPDGRPFMNPSLEFHSLYRPDVVGHGFGYSALAEAYWNLGQVGALLLFAILALALGQSYKWAKVRQEPLSIAWFSGLAFQSLWFLRGDSLAFVKALTWHVLVILLIWMLAHLLCSSRHGRTRRA